MLATTPAPAAEPPSPFAIRGTLPWHNFLSGPSAWDEADYEKYLDEMKALGLNYITFHCYTGGAERYATYVEPIIRIQYRDILPEAAFDTSLTARWGYRPLPVSEFAFDTGKLFNLPPGAQAFGAQCAILAKNKQDHYDRAQTLMRRVVEMAHARGIQVGIGFEFGIHPPEFASIIPPQSFLRGANLPDPTHPASLEILHNTIDDILRAYPGVDWIWLWLHEHTMHIGRPWFSDTFGRLMQRDGPLFKDAEDETDVFTGVWSLTYIRLAQEHLARRAPGVRLAVSGWGGGAQLPGTLRGLDRGLPTNIVFTCLSPSQGWAPQLPVMEELAKHRPVWAIPWLEGDARLWHLQPRVSILRDHVQLAEKQGLQGVLAIHWRTEEMRANLKAFGQFTAAPAKASSVEDFYRRDCQEQFGAAADKIAPILVRFDREQSIAAASAEYLPYDPGWGRLKPELRASLAADLEEIKKTLANTKEQAHRTNINWLADNLEFTLLLDEVSRNLEPAYRLKERWVLGNIVDGDQFKMQVFASRESLGNAPMEKLFKCYARRVRSKGELGELSSLNQRVWTAYRELERFLNEQANR